MPDSHTETRPLADAADRLHEITQIVRMLRLQCVDLTSEGGVDVGVSLTFIERELAHESEHLSRMVSTQLQNERASVLEPSLRRIKAPFA